MTKIIKMNTIAVFFSDYPPLVPNCNSLSILLLWTRFVLGAKVYGRENIRGLKSGVTVCNHVHLLDSALIGVTFFPRRVVFPTLTQNVKTLWPGKLVRILGGFAIPDNIMELKAFFDEMEFF